jgi:ATP-dependent RNA helicase RhlE
LVSSDESGLLRDIERVLRRSIPTVPTPVFKMVESAPQPSSHGNRAPGSHPGNAPGNRAPGNRASQGRQGSHGGRDARRAPAGGGTSGTRSFGQQQRGRFR